MPNEESNAARLMKQDQEAARDEHNQEHTQVHSYDEGCAWWRVFTQTLCFPCFYGGSC